MSLGIREGSPILRRGLRLISLAAIAVLVVGACGGSKSSGGGAVTVRWFVGLGSGTQPSQIDAQKKFVADYNKANKSIQIKLEIIPSSNATDTLKTEMAAGNAPDIIGPVGVGGRNGFYGTLADLTKLASDNKFDLTQFPTDMVNILKQGDSLVSLPYAIYPAFILYNKDLFGHASLPDLPAKVGDKYNNADWTWDEVKTIGMQLTLDANGKHPGETGFDANSIVQFGLDFQYWDGRRIASAFGTAGAQIIAADGKTASFSDNFKAAVKYFYDGMWTSNFIPTGKYRSSDLLNNGATFASGKVAMNAANTWCLGGCYYGTQGKTNMTSVDFAVMPSFNTVTAGPLDFDGFSITKVSKHPTEAFKAMVAIMASPALLSTYGSLPAIVSMRQAWEDGKTTEAKTFFSGVQTLQWGAIADMANHPANPSHEGYVPNYTKAVTDYSTMFTTLQNSAGLNVDDQLTALQKVLQADFDAYTAPPLL